MDENLTRETTVNLLENVQEIWSHEKVTFCVTIAHNIYIIYPFLNPTSLLLVLFHHLGKC